MKQKTKQKKEGKAEVGKVVKKPEHGDVLVVPLKDVEYNPWNPNEMSADEFNLLSENIEDVDNLQPVLVVPLENVDGVQKYRCIDGEHRLEVERLRDTEMVKVVYADPKLFDETMQKKQTVRMNKIKGSLNQTKFNMLVNDLIDTGGFSYDDLGRELGFADEDEFQHLLDHARDGLNPEMQSSL